MFIFNPDVKDFKSKAGAIHEDEEVIISVKSDFNWVNLLILKDGDGYERYSMTFNESASSFFVPFKGKSGLYYYHFETEGGLYGADYDLSATKQNYNCYRDYQLTISDNGYETPDLLKGAVIYQIFPDRFYRGGNAEIEQGKILCRNWGETPTYRNGDGQILNNEFFGGDFKGITEKLDYLADLGVTVVYLNPIVKAFSSHRYDAGDYMKVDPLLGTEKDLVNMLNEGKKRGISFIFDGVYNHTGADSKYFNRYLNYDSVGAYNSKESPYYDWYEFYDYPDGYSSWWNFSSLPSIRKNSESFQNFILDKVLPHYFEMGFKGVRLDVVDELTDDFVEKIRTVAKSYGAVVIGEVWEDATNKTSYGVRRKYFLGKELDSVMNYQLKDGICDFLINYRTDYLTHVIETQLNNFPKTALDNLMNVLSTHDTVRIINNLGRKEVVTDKDKLKDVVLSEEEIKKGKKLARVAYALLFTVYGSPSVYYGDEVGLTGDLDPYNRRCFPWGNEDKEHLCFFKKLSALRKHPVFIDGEFNLLYHTKGVLVYERVNDDTRIIVAASVHFTEVTIKFSESLVNLLEDDKAPLKEITLTRGTVAILKQIG